MKDSVKDWRGGVGKDEVGLGFWAVGVLPRSQVKPLPQGGGHDEGAQSCAWPCLI